MRKLIRDQTDEKSLLQYCSELLERVVDDALSIQPVLQRRIDEFIAMVSELFKGVLVRDEIPMTNLLACISMELLKKMDKKVDAFYDRKKNNHLTVIYNMLSSNAGVPPWADVENCVRHQSDAWNPLPYPRSCFQCEALHLK